VYEAGDGSVTIDRADGSAVVDTQPAQSSTASADLDVVRAAAAAQWTLSDAGVRVSHGEALTALLARSRPSSVTR
jgi:hypothetical protein